MKYDNEIQAEIAGGKNRAVVIDEAKVKELTKKLDEQYGNTVLSPDNYETHDELEAILKHNEHAKEALSAQREEEMIQRSIEREEKIKAGFRKGTKMVKGWLNKFKTLFVSKSKTK